MGIDHPTDEATHASAPHPSESTRFHSHLDTPEAKLDTDSTLIFDLVARAPALK